LALAAVAADDTGTIAVDGPAVTVATSPGQNAVRAFTAAAGQRITARIHEVFYPQARVSVLDPEGAALWTGWPRAAQEVSTEGLVLPAAGTYRVAGEPERPAAGSLAVAVTSVPPDDGRSVLVGGPPVTIDIRSPEPAERHFVARARSRVRVRVSELTVASATFRLLTSDGRALTSWRMQDASADTTDALPLPYHGLYRISVDPEGASAGGLRLAVAGVPPDDVGTIVVDGPAVAVATTAPGQNAERSSTPRRGSGSPCASTR
jgi:hypothetical protein